MAELEPVRALQRGVSRRLRSASAHPPADRADTRPNRGRVRGHLPGGKHRPEPDRTHDVVGAARRRGVALPRRAARSRSHTGPDARPSEERARARLTRRKRARARLTRRKRARARLTRRKNARVRAYQYSAASSEGRSARTPTVRAPSLPCEGPERRPTPKVPAAPAHYLNAI